MPFHGKYFFITFPTIIVAFACTFVAATLVSHTGWPLQDALFVLTGGALSASCFLFALIRWRSRLLPNRTFTQLHLSILRMLV